MIINNTVSIPDDLTILSFNFFIFKLSIVEPYKDLTPFVAILFPILNTGKNLFKKT